MAVDCGQSSVFEQKEPNQVPEKGFLWQKYCAWCSLNNNNNHAKVKR